MFERHCVRDDVHCPVCRMKTTHCRVRSLTKFVAGQAVYGWECETCGSVHTDSEGLYTKQSRNNRGYA